jgi:hypothetical protein
MSAEFPACLDLPDLTYLLTYLLTELSPSWEADNCAATQELPGILRNPKVHQHVHKSPPLVPILSQIEPVPFQILSPKFYLDKSMNYGHSLLHVSASQCHHQAAINWRKSPQCTNSSVSITILLLHVVFEKCTLALPSCHFYIRRSRCVPCTWFYFIRQRMTS